MCVRLVNNKEITTVRRSVSRKWSDIEKNIKRNTLIILYSSRKLVTKKQEHPV